MVKWFDLGRGLCAVIWQNEESPKPAVIAGSQPQQQRRKRYTLLGNDWLIHHINTIFSTPHETRMSKPFK